LRDPERSRALKRDPGDPERGGAGHLLAAPWMTHRTIAIGYILAVV
jgi:hypothetical protein